VPGINAGMTRPPPPARSPLPVIINSGGGTARRLGDKLAEQVNAAFAATGQEIDLCLVEGKDLAAAITNAVGRTVAVGGGDGTISTAASILSDQRRRLAVFPLGTLNHFAQDIGLDGTLEQAAVVAAGDHSRHVDLGVAGNRVFINNASLGLYARMVRDRDRRPLPKWLATIPAAFGVWLRPDARAVRITVDGRPRIIRTPLLFFGNNRYSLAAGHLGQRSYLEDGLLSLYALAERGSLGLVLSGARIMAGRPDPHSDFAALEDAREVVVSGHGSHHVAMDGEVVKLRFPLRVGIRPGALEVMVPAGEIRSA
jgi:diacylglycerol kinase family enzyme